MNATINAKVHARLAAAALSLAAALLIFGAIDHLATATPVSPLWAAAVDSARA